MAEDSNYDIVPLTKGMFEKLHPAVPFARNFVANEKEWYKTPEGEALGALFQDRNDLDWGYSTFRRDSEEGFKLEEVKHSIETRDLAREQLLSELRNHRQNSAPTE